MWTECLLRCCMLLPVVPVGSGDVAGFPVEEPQISQPARLEEVDFAKAFAEAKPWDLQASKNAVHTICEIRKEVGLATLCEFSCASDESGELKCCALAGGSQTACEGGTCCAKTCCGSKEGAPACCAAKSDASACSGAACCKDAACCESACDKANSCQAAGTCTTSKTLMTDSDQEFHTLMLSEFGVPAEEVHSFHIELVNEAAKHEPTSSESPEAVRKAGRELDQVANDLEDQGMYETADQLRRISQQLRERVRR